MGRTHAIGVEAAAGGRSGIEIAIQPSLVVLILIAMPVAAHAQSALAPGSPGNPTPTVRFPPGVSVVEVPFRFEGNTILLDARVNGSDPLVFVLDTGTYDNVVMKPQKLEGVKLDFGGSEGESGGHGHVRVAQGVRLDLGQLQLEGGELAVMPQSTLSGLGKVAWDGILGDPFFENLVVEVDWENETLRLHDPAVFEPPKDALSIPLEREAGHIYLSSDVEIEGKTTSVRLIVDTGSTGALSLRSDRVSVPSRRVVDVILGRGLGGVVKGDFGRVDKLLLGDLEFEGVLTTFLDNSSKMIAVRGDGNLGLEVLRRTWVAFDYPNNRMLLMPSAVVTEPFIFTTSGLRIENEIAEDGTISVLDVYADTPAAEAGLAVGDRIVSMNSQPVQELGVKSIRALLRQEPGITVRLGIKSADAMREVELKLEKILWGIPSPDGITLERGSSSARI